MATTLNQILNSKAGTSIRNTLAPALGLPAMAANDLYNIFNGIRPSANPGAVTPLPQTVNTPQASGPVAPAVTPATPPVFSGTPPVSGAPSTQPGAMSPQDPAALKAKADAIYNIVNGGADISNYAGKEYMDPAGGPSVADARSDYGKINDARNDMVSGATDPFAWASKSGIPYTADELGAIEKAQGGIYDPALNDAKQRYLSSVDVAKNKSTNQNQITDNERAAQIAFQGNQIVKDYNTVIGQKNAIDSILNSGTSGPNDVAIVYNFMKALDPNSVVRESEYASAANSGNIFTGALAKFNGLFNPNGGTLSPQVKQQFQQIVNEKLAAQTSLYKNFADQQRAIAQRQGLNPDNVVIDFSGGLTQPDTSGGDVIKFPDGTSARKLPDGTYEEVQSFSPVAGDTNTAGGNRPQRNNNPLNIKASPSTMQFSGVSGLDPSPASDGGQFLTFNSPQAGMNAAKQLITSSGYSGLTVDQALRRWSGNGYGGEIAPSLAGRTINSLSDAELNSLVNTMAHREGYYA